MNRAAPVLVSRGGTLLGQALVRRLQAQGFTHVLEGPDPVDGPALRAFFAEVRPAYVFVPGGRSGGIQANTRYPADLMLDNLLIAANLFPLAHEFGVEKLLYLASSCVYPRLAPQPLAVESLWQGPLEPTNEAYATSRLAALTLGRAYRQQHGAPFFTAIPTNLYGPGDHVSAEDAHVIPSLLIRMHRAREAGAPEVVLWGTGTPRREFLYVDDVADAALVVMDQYSGEAPVNLAGGEDVSILELAALVAGVVGYTGALRCDTSRPDGMPLKALDGGPLAALGWRPTVGLREGLARTYAALLEEGIPPQ